MTERELRDESVELLRDLLRIDTSNPPGRETPAAMLLKDYLEANGVECELVAKDPDRANLVARIPGSGDGPSLALVGHTDVVPADAQDWRRPPFSGDLDDGRLPLGSRLRRHEERDRHARRDDGRARARGLPAARRPPLHRRGGRGGRHGARSG